MKKTGPDSMSSHPSTHPSSKPFFLLLLITPLPGPDLLFYNQRVRTAQQLQNRMYRRLQTWLGVWIRTRSVCGKSVIFHCLLGVQDLAPGDVGCLDQANPDLTQRQGNELSRQDLTLGREGRGFPLLL